MHQRGKHRLTAIFVAFSAIVTPTAFAADVVVSVPLTVQSVLNGNDSLTVLPGAGIDVSGTPGTVAVDGLGNAHTINNLGTLRSLGLFAFAISAVDDNTVINGGLIETGDAAAPAASDFARGIDVFDRNFVWNYGRIVTHGTNSDAVSVGDFNTVVNDGAILTFGTFAYGIEGFFDNTLINTGSIVTHGEDARGIDVVDGNAVENWGTIATKGRFADGVLGGDFNIITNRGLVTTDGDEADGILASSFNRIWNSGKIVTSGDTAEGIDVLDFNIVTNSGLIASTGRLGQLIKVEDFNVVRNTGTLVTHGRLADAIDAGFFNRIFNSGFIHTTGPDADGIDVEDGNNVTNSGFILSEQADAFELDFDNILNLLAPSFIGGGIDLGTDTTLNIVTGRSHSVLWDFSTGTMVGGMPTVTGSVGHFWNPSTRQFATIDPTAFSVAGDMVADLTGRVSGVARRRLSGLDTNGPAVLGFLAEADKSGVRQTNPTGHESQPAYQSSHASKVWIDGFGGYGEFGASGEFNSSDYWQWGVIAGQEQIVRPDLTLGIMSGFLRGRHDVDSVWFRSQKVTSDGVVAGVYGRRPLSRAQLDFSLTSGLQSHDSSRLVNNNLAALGREHARADYYSVFLSPEMTLAVDYDVSSRWTLQPGITVRHAAQWIGGFTEIGSAANASVGDRFVQVTEGRLELAASRQFALGVWTGRIGALGRTHSGDETVDVSLIGDKNAVAGLRKQSYAGALIGTDANIAINDIWEVKLSADAVLSEGDTHALTGRIGAVARF